MTFEKAFNQFILNQKVAGWGFRPLTNIKQADGCNREIGGYYTEYENGYKLIVNGATLGTMPIQEAMVLDPQWIMVGRDIEDLLR